MTFFSTRLALKTLSNFSARSSTKPSPKAIACSLSCSLMLVLSCVAETFATEEPQVPAGNYTIDKSHTSVLFRVNHLGFSMYTARFKGFDAEIYFDPQALEKSTLNVSIDATSIETDFPTPEVIDFNKMLQDVDWLNTKKYPTMTFVSKKIDVIAENKMQVAGDFTLRGITKTIIMDVTYNGGYAGHPMDPNARTGFSASTTFNRSDFGMGYGIPAPGTTMGVSDAVNVIIETEFSGPPSK